MRSVKELLELMLEHEEEFAAGLCGWINLLNFSGVITYDEYNVLSEYIDHNRPSKYSSLSAYKNRNKGFYWKLGEIAPRIKWIKKQIKKL